MTSSPAQRPWWKLHGLAWTCLAFLGPAWVVLNFLGQPPTLGGRAGWHFGWPSQAAFQPYRSRSAKSGMAVGVGRTSRWMNVRLLEETHILGLVANGAIAFAAVAGSLWTIERLCRKLPSSSSYSMALLLAATAWMACFIELNYRHFVSLRDLLFHASLIVAYGALLLAWLAFVDIVGITWDKLTRRREA